MIFYKALVVPASAAGCSGALRVSGFLLLIVILLLISPPGCGAAVKGRIKSKSKRYKSDRLLSVSGL